MTATATRKEGLPESYYAPEFAIEIEGEELDPASKGDVLELKIEMTFNEMTSAEVKLNNFDDTAYDLKWSDADKLRLGSRVHVKLGYEDRTRSMMRGYISTLTPEFADGPPTLTVRALDGMVRLKSSKPPADEVTYKKVTDWQIAQKIAQRHNLRVKVTEQGPVHDLVVQRNIDDATFLKERAKLLSFEVFMRTDPDTGEDVLHFVSPTDGRGSEPISTYILAWGGMRNTDTPPSLIEFKPDARGRGPGPVRDGARMGSEDQEEDHSDGDTREHARRRGRSTTRAVLKPPRRWAGRANRSAKSSSIDPWPLRRRRSRSPKRSSPSVPTAS